MNPFSSRWIHPANNAYRFHVDLAVDRERREAFYKQLISTLKTHRFASVVGPHGTGKSTLLRGAEAFLEEAFETVSWIALSTQKRCSWREVWARHEAAMPQTEKASMSCLIVDGFEQLSWWSRKALVFHVWRQPTATLLVTSHRKHRFIPISHQTHWDKKMTKWLAAEKLADVAEPMRTLLWSKLQDRIAKLGDAEENVRDLWFAMYDEFESIRQQEHLRP